MNKFLEAMRFAHACKIFDENKKIPREQLLEILEAGRLTPSSFGLEHTRMIVISNQKLKEAMMPLCWNQKQFSTCSEVVVLTSLLQDIIAPSAYIQNSMQERGLDERYLNRLKNFQEENFKERKDYESWSKKQAYLVASSMVNCAAFMGIDSCYIEGFEVEKLENFFEIEIQKERIALVLTFGYRIQEQKPKYRKPLEELVNFRD
ncbi:NAD(P)H-dependent oxidoreductase [Helicobacter cholecystus]|uniref:NAD(P)H-dependent oxidoreductase n=1 Tax=Helicobacter cholecystus TaxID=45498 RepID=A0A3D8IVL6_9HELI|nr:NAD(P)H-dependent oxidoreductase [Helicobacter cholecystus]RDU69298.1 NAD(P)H-dependent oxidoreductase [Helicobacter cholecystus]VEJ24376.1 NAD(P)H-flavin oxidoreductase [Helicobacter cholecystus]